ncbi:MAG: tryptophan--tRNA ligase [bacterium]
MGKKRALTGVKPTGTFHIGNYLGALKPALELADNNYETFYFIANYHALTTMHSKKDLEELTYSHVASWLAFGSQEKNVTLYLQSDIPEIFELAWVLSCFATKGLLERAHAYKDAVAKGDRIVNHGLFSYPVLMAADIVVFDTDYVPVGKDQKQHVEIARDIVGAFNTSFGSEILKAPQPLIKQEVMVIPGIDGEKMSKSYNNIIPVFAEAEEIRKIVARVKTDSSKVEEPKDPDKNIIYNIYKLLASKSDVETLRSRFLNGGLGWKEAKDILADTIIEKFKEPRQKYNEILTDRNKINKILANNADHARETASKVMARVRESIGIVKS